MTLDELMQHLEDAGFQRKSENPTPEQNPEPSKEPEKEPAFDAEALQRAIENLTSALQANAIKTVVVDNQQPKKETAEDILGTILMGKPPEK